MLVAAAGPFMNLVLAVIASVVIVVLGKAGVLSPDLLKTLIGYLVLLNLMLLFFNLIPLGPLDGAAVLAGLLPKSMYRIAELNRKYGMLILLMLFFAPQLGVPGLNFVLRPAYFVADRWIDLLNRHGVRVSADGGNTAYRVTLARVRRAARPAAAPVQDARARHRQHPDRVHHAQVPRVPRGDAVDVRRRRGRLPGDGGDARLPQVARAGADAGAARHVGRGG